MIENRNSHEEKSFTKKPDLSNPGLQRPDTRLLHKINSALTLTNNLVRDLTSIDEVIKKIVETQAKRHKKRSGQDKIIDFRATTQTDQLNQIYPQPTENHTKRTQKKRNRNSQLKPRG